MATNTDLFIELLDLGSFENMRNAQRLSPTAPYPFNVPISSASVPGATAFTADFRRPRFCMENYTGSLAGIAVPIPYYPADPASVADGGQANWASGDVGSGIDTDFTDAASRTRYYALGWESEALAQIGLTDGTLQPTGRLMEFGWDSTSTWKSIVLTQSSSLRKISITVPNLSGALPPACVGVTTFRLTLWVCTALPANAADRRGTAMSYVGECANTGGTIVDAYSAADLGLRQYFPANLRNAIASRAMGAYGKRFFFMGNSIGLESREFTTLQTTSVNATVAKVRSGAATNILVLRRDASSTNKPYDPRVMEITGITLSVPDGMGNYNIATISVAGYDYLEDGQEVFIDNINGVSGINGLTWTVSNAEGTSFKINGGVMPPYPFSGAWTDGGDAALSVFTIPDWWLGLNIAVSGTVGTYTIIRVVAEGGTNTGIEIYPAVPASISTNAAFSIYGPQTVRFGGSDPRFKQMCAVGEDVDVSRLRGPVTAGFESPDGNGVFVYSRVAGLYITNIARELPITGLAGGTPGTQPRLEDTPLSYGSAGPNAVAPGPNGTYLGWSPEMGPWIQQGASQTLLDPQQLFAEFYRGLRYTATLDGVEDVTPRIGIAYNQNENVARFIFPKQDQYFRYDFRTNSLCLDNMLAQKIQAIATRQVFSPVAYDVTTGLVHPDALANVGDNTIFAVQYGDIAEWNPSLFVDLARYYDTDDAGDSPYIGVVTGVDTDTISVGSPGGNLSNKIANETVILVDTTLEDEQFPGTVTNASISGAPDAGRYATITMSASKNVTVGGLIYVRGIGGITGINSAAEPATPTYWRVLSVPSPDTFVIDSGANGTFTGTYTDGGTVYFLTFGERQGSYRITAAKDNSGGGTLDFFGQLQWTAGAPLVGDIVVVGAILARYESTDIRVGTYGQIEAVDRFAMDDESTSGYAVQFRVIPSGLGYTPIEADSTVTAYPSMMTAIGKQFLLAPSDTGESVRLRVTWGQPPDGPTRLNSFTIKGHGFDGSFNKQVGVFPDSGTRANRQYISPPDLNLTRDAEAKALTPRSGSRVLTVFTQSQPYLDQGFGGASTTETLDSAVLFLSVGGQACLTVNTTSSRFAYEGFENGTVKIQPVLSLGTIRDAVPEATY